MSQRKTPKKQQSATITPLASHIGHEINAWWWSLPSVYRRGLLGAIGSFGFFLMLLGFLPAAEHTWLTWLTALPKFLFGLPAFLVPICGLCFSIAILFEIFQERCILQERWVWGSLFTIFTLATELHVMFGTPVGGKIGQFGGFLLSPLPPVATQFALIGGFCLDIILSFRITWRTIEGIATPFAQRTASVNASHTLASSLQPMGIDVDAISPQPYVTLTNIPHQPNGMQNQFQASSSVEPSLPSLPPVSQPQTYAHQFGDSLSVPTFLRRGVANEKSAPSEHSSPILPPLPVLPTQPSDFQLPPLPAKAAVVNSSQSLVETVPGKRVAASTGTSAVPAWTLPPLHLLNTAPESRSTNALEHAERLAAIIERTLRSFAVDAEVRRSDISVGPTIIRFGIRPLERIRTDDKGRAVTDNTGEPIVTRTRVSRIMNLKDDLALVLEVKSLRMEAPVPERPYVGIEIPNMFGKMVTLREILESKEFTATGAKSKLTVALGRDVAGRIRVGDISRFPHVLIAGATGAGKSVCLNAFIASIIMEATPAEVRFVMIDPKMVELMMYDGIPHLLAPVITDPAQVVAVLDKAIGEMEHRYRLFSRLGVRNLAGYHAMRTSQRPELDPLPHIVLIIDELADLMIVAPDDVERQICRLAQLARATGIHLVVATQRPSVDVITGLIKANIPTRIAFMVASGVDSRTILDSVGAEHLLGKGDMLFLASDVAKGERIQGAYVADDEVERLAHFWRSQRQHHRQALPQWTVLPADEKDYSATTD